MYDVVHISPATDKIKNNINRVYFSHLLRVVPVSNVLFEK